MVKKPKKEAARPVDPMLKMAKNREVMIKKIVRRRVRAGV